MLVMVMGYYLAKIVMVRKGCRKKNPEKLSPFDKPGVGRGKKRRQTSILENYFFSEHVESF